MKYYDMKPVAKPHTNARLGGRPATTNEDSVIGGEIQGLPITVTEDGQQTISIWKCDSILQRLRFLFQGEVSLTVLGKQRQAVSLSIGDSTS